MWGWISRWVKRWRSVSVGRLGERLARRHLEGTRGFRTLATNWRHGRDELDLVGWDRDILVFVEVKTRTAGALVPGYYAVNQRKRKALLRAARAYYRDLRVKPASVRFDVVEVSRQVGKKPTILHFENVPLFSKEFARGWKKAGN